MNRISNRRATIIGAVILLVIILGFIPFPYSVKGPYRILPHTEWALIQVSPERLLSRQIRFDFNRLEHFTLLQFDRQDFVQFTLDSSHQESRWVDQGEFIAEIQSSENRLLLENYIGLMEKARADVNVVRTGEKRPIIEANRQKLEFAKAELAAYEPLYNRNGTLYKQKLISAEEWEISKSAFELYRRNVLLREAELMVVESGEKSEIIKSMEAELLRIENQLGEIKNKIGLGRLTAPIDGLLTYHLEDSILCRVSHIDSVVVQVPIPLYSGRFIENGQMLTVLNPGTPGTYEFEINRISQIPVVIRGKSYLLVTGLRENPDHILLPGMVGLARVHCGRLSLFQRLQFAGQQYRAF